MNDLFQEVGGLRIPASQGHYSPACTTEVMLCYCKHHDSESHVLKVSVQLHIQCSRIFVSDFFQ